MSPQSEAAIRKAIVALVLTQFVVFTAMLQPMADFVRLVVLVAGTVPAYALYKLNEALYP